MAWLQTLLADIRDGTLLFILWVAGWIKAFVLGIFTSEKIPVGAFAKDIFKWMERNLSALFDAIAGALEALIDAILWLLETPHPLVVVAAFVALTWALQRRWPVTIGVALGLLFVIDQGYWKETSQSLTLIIASCVVCMAAGVPLGIMAAHRPRFYAALSPVLDLMQTLPTFVYLIPAVIFFGLGMVPGLIATVIFVLPAPIRLTQLGVASTPTALLEAATAFGATPRQRLLKVELPWALPQIMVGLNQTIMLSLSMVVIASMVGANGLGNPVMRALANVDAAKGFESGFVIVVVAIVLDRMLRRVVK